MKYQNKPLQVAELPPLARTILIAVHNPALWYSEPAVGINADETTVWYVALDIEIADDDDDWIFALCIALGAVDVIERPLATQAIAALRELGVLDFDRCDKGHGTIWLDLCDEAIALWCDESPTRAESKPAQDFERDLTLMRMATTRERGKA